jgi:hypothetical protein
VIAKPNANPIVNVPPLATTTVPVPKKTSIKVPRNSAKYFFIFIALPSQIIESLVYLISQLL